MKNSFGLSRCGLCRKPFEYEERKRKYCSDSCDPRNNWRNHGRDRVRGMVRKRDTFTCQSCKRVWKEGERAFDVHHLKGLCGKKSRGYDKESAIKHLITYCHKCHYKFHRKDANHQGRAVMVFSRKRAQTLRAKGLSYDAIGKKLKVSQSAIWQALNPQPLK